MSVVQRSRFLCSLYAFFFLCASLAFLLFILLVLYFHLPLSPGLLLAVPLSWQTSLCLCLPNLLSLSLSPSLSLSLYLSLLFFSSFLRPHSSFRSGGGRFSYISGHQYEAKKFEWRQGPYCSQLCKTQKMIQTILSKHIITEAIVRSFRILDNCAISLSLSCDFSFPLSLSLSRSVYLLLSRSWM